MRTVSPGRRKLDLPTEAIVRGRAEPTPETTVVALAPGSRYLPPENHRVLFRKADITTVDFADTQWRGFQQIGSTFTDCDFSGARFVFAELGTMPTETVFRGCRFDRADLRNAHLGHARFERCDFRNARIVGWSSDIAEFVGCRFEGRLEECNFRGRPWGPLGDGLRPRRERNEFRDNDFSAADLRDCSFLGGIDIAAQRWPTGSEYVRLTSFPQRLAAAGTAVAAWPAGPDRTGAEVMLAVYSHPDQLEQQEAFLRRDDIRIGISPEVRDSVWALLEGAR
jgi:hypothetical protein